MRLRRLRRRDGEMICIRWSLESGLVRDGSWRDYRSPEIDHWTMEISADTRNMNVLIVG